VSLCIMAEDAPVDWVNISAADLDRLTYWNSNGDKDIVVPRLQHLGYTKRESTDLWKQVNLNPAGDVYTNEFIGLMGAHARERIARITAAIPALQTMDGSRIEGTQDALRIAHTASRAGAGIGPAAMSEAVYVTADRGYLRSKRVFTRLGMGLHPRTNVHRARGSWAGEKRDFF